MRYAFHMSIRPKEWLVKNGHLPAGSENARGRISRENIALIEAAVASGVDILGYSRSGPASTVEPPKVERAAAQPATVVADIGDPTHPELERREGGLYLREAFAGTVNVGMRTVCNNCKRSLTYCLCESPKVWVDHSTESVVNFRTRKVPDDYRVNRWW